METGRSGIECVIVFLETGCRSFDATFVLILSSGAEDESVSSSLDRCATLEVGSNILPFSRSKSSPRGEELVSSFLVRVNTLRGAPLWSFDATSADLPNDKAAPVSLLTYPLFDGEDLLGLRF
jgi:hypothetical protein